MPITITSNFTVPSEFLAALNAARRANPQQWIFYAGTVAGRAVELKTFGAGWLQRFVVDGRSMRLPAMDCKVRDWTAAILAPFTA